MSVSTSWRQQGNDLFQKVHPGMAPVLARGNYEKALNMYYKAENTAGNNMDDLASAKKNLGLTSLKLARVLELQQEKAALIDFYFKMALEKFCEAWKSKGEKGEEWAIGIKTLTMECFINIEDRLENLDTDVKIQKLESMIPFLIDDEHKGTVFSKLTLLVFEQALIKLMMKDFKSALSYLKDCYYPVSEGLRFATTEELKAAFELHQEDIFIQTCVAESLQALNIGDELFKSAMLDEEELNMDSVYNVMDVYRQAITLTRDKDIELEAIAHCRLGKIYQKVLKMDGRARNYYSKCIELANTLVPRNVHYEDWYRAAADALFQYQEADRKREEEARNELREEILKKRKDEYDLLVKNHSDMGKVEFLQFVYKTYPPINKKHKLGKLSDNPKMAEVKKLYQKAVIHYHPDKVSNEEKEWKVMTEEITKLLTSHYENFKQL